MRLHQHKCVLFPKADYSLLIAKLALWIANLVWLRHFVFKSQSSIIQEHNSQAVGLPNCILLCYVPHSKRPMASNGPSQPFTRRRFISCSVQVSWKTNSFLAFSALTWLNKNPHSKDIRQESLMLPGCELYWSNRCFPFFTQRGGANTHQNTIRLAHQA